MSKFAYIASSLISAAALISASLLLNSCSNETPAAQETRTISISVGLSRPGFTDIATRTALSENDKGGLNSRWNSTDEVMVSDGTGILGTLKVDPETIENLEDGSSHAEFTALSSFLPILKIMPTSHSYIAAKHHKFRRKCKRQLLCHPDRHTCRPRRLRPVIKSHTCDHHRQFRIY